MNILMNQGLSKTMNGTQTYGQSSIKSPTGSIFSRPKFMTQATRDIHLETEEDENEQERDTLKADIESRAALAKLSRQVSITTIKKKKQRKLKMFYQVENEKENQHKTITETVNSFHSSAVENDKVMKQDIIRQKKIFQQKLKQRSDIDCRNLLY